jgi:predicted Zn-dependent peptidase
MRARILLVTLLLIVAAAPATQAEGLQIPPIEAYQLDNGIEVELVRHTTVPMAAIEVWISAGAVDDPAGQEGLAALSADALRKGAGDRDAAAFAEAVDFLGARFSTSVDVERTRIRLNLQTRDLDAGLGLLADAILRPRLEDAEITKLRDQMAEQVKSDKENPRNVLGAYHRAHVFASHPYGTPVNGTESSLPAIAPDAVRRFHADHFSANRTQITVVGDIEIESVRAMIEERFGAMSRGENESARIEAASLPDAAGVLLVNKNDTPQTWFRIGSLGPSWSDLNDYAAVEIVRTVFGGPFTSWLNSALRIEAGLTYGAGYRMWRAGLSGEACISTFTATATTGEALDMALAQLKRLHEEGLNESDLASAKAYMKGQLPYDYETATSIAAALAEMKFHGIGREWVDDIFAEINAVTLEDCRAAVDRWFVDENLQITAVGVASEIRDTLAGYGPVTVRENSDDGFDAIPPGGQSR